MPAAIILLVVVVLVVGVAITLYLRSWIQEQSRAEAHMHDPDIHTVDYAIPNGIDPVLFTVELHRAGFHTGLERVGDDECLRIECHPTEHEQVRRVIERVPLRGYDGADLKVDHVVFKHES